MKLRHRHQLDTGMLFATSIWQLAAYAPTGLGPVAQTLACTKAAHLHDVQGVEPGVHEGRVIREVVRRLPAALLDEVNHRHTYHRHDVEVRCV